MDRPGSFVRSTGVLKRSGREEWGSPRGKVSLNRDVEAPSCASMPGAVSGAFRTRIASCPRPLIRDAKFLQRATHRGDLLKESSDPT